MGVLSYSCALVALGIACLALIRTLVAPKGIKPLRKAFEALEEEFDVLSDKVASHLGRISRLKRDIGAGKILPEVAQEPGKDDGDATAELTSYPGLSPRQAKFQEQILARRRKGGIQ